MSVANEVPQVAVYRALYDYSPPETHEDQDYLNIIVGDVLEVPLPDGGSATETEGL